MKNILGFNNFSFCLRNSEHIANYVFFGIWVSYQMNEEQILYKEFIKYIKEEKKTKLINCNPDTLRFDIDGGKVYKNIEPIFEYTGIDYFIDDTQKTYNILVIGPKGSGKSKLINVLFNKNIYESGVNLNSVKNEIYFTRGKTMITNFETKKTEKKDVIVIDTIGICDTYWEEEKEISFIKERISRNMRIIHCVLIIIRAGRISKETKTNILNIMKWLDYKKNFLNFKIIITHCEDLNEKQRTEYKYIIAKTFDLKENVDNSEEILYSVECVGFMKEDYLNDKGKKDIEISIERLSRLITLETCNPINLNNKIKIKNDKCPSWC